MFAAIKALFQKSPTEDWYAKGTNPYTPDMVKLETRPYWRVFIPDEMQKSHMCNPWLGEDATLRCWAQTQDHFAVWRKKMGKASQIVPLDTKFSFAPYLCVRGELWKVPTERLIAIDTIKANGVQFLRQRVKLNIPYNIEMNKDKGDASYLQAKSGLLEIDAWMYVGNPEHWKYKLVHGSKVFYSKDGVTTQGRMVDGDIYVPVGTYKPKNDLLENYYHYTSNDTVGDS